LWPFRPPDFHPHSESKGTSDGTPSLG
jgi:hypothetical protein